MTYWTMSMNYSSKISKKRTVQTKIIIDDHCAPSYGVKNKKSKNKSYKGMFHHTRICCKKYIVHLKKKIKYRTV